MAPSSQPPVGCVSVWEPIRAPDPFLRERPNKYRPHQSLHPAPLRSPLRPSGAIRVDRRQRHATHTLGPAPELL
jgi:hypothetical protein